MRMTGYYCAGCKCDLCDGRKVKTIERGHPAAPPPGEAVDYMGFVCVDVRWRGTLIASLCEGGGSFTNSICFLIYRMCCAEGSTHVSSRGFIFYMSLVGFSCNTLPSRRTLKNSRLVCKKDDVHVCIMCLRAIMNYQVSPQRRCAQTARPAGLKHTHVRLEPNSVCPPAPSPCFICYAESVMHLLFSLLCQLAHLPDFAVVFSPCSTASTWSCRTHML